MPYDCDSYNLSRDFRLALLGGSNTASLSAGAFILHITMSVSGASKEFGACLMIVMNYFLCLAFIFPLLAVVVAILIQMVCLLYLFKLALKVGLHILVLAYHL